MRAPFLRQGVQLLGQPGVFLVVSINHWARTATLLRTGDEPQGLVHDVPFTKIVTVDPDVYRARVRSYQAFAVCTQ